MRYRIRRHSASAPSISPPHLIAILLPAPLPAEPCRPTGRLETRRHPARYSTRLLAIISPLHLIAPSHRLIRSARCLPASFRRPPSPSAFRPSGSSISSARHISSGSSPVPPRFPLCFPPGVPPRLLARLVHLIGLSPCPLLANAPTYAAHPSHRLITRISSLRSIR